MDTPQLLEAAKKGDGAAFGLLIEPYRHELQVHAYRMVGSTQDAEDLTQEALLAAWRALGGYEQRASLRTWLYRITTNRCLDFLRAGSRKMPEPTAAPLFTSAPTRRNEVAWIEPYPDLLLDGLVEPGPGPESRYEATESISLAFVTALQLLSPQQRAVVALRDVLGFRAREAAGMLGISLDAANSALKRARKALNQRLPAAPAQRLPARDIEGERRLLDRLTAAYTAGDVETILGLLADDVSLSMPPLPFEYHGLDAAAEGLTRMFSGKRRFKLVETRANRQPAFGIYVRDTRSQLLHATGLLVLAVESDTITALTWFDKSVIARFGLPRTLQA